MSVGCLLIFSAKAPASLSAEALEFYALHTALLNFLKERRRKLITSGRTVVAYVPVICDAKHIQPTDKSKDAGSRSHSKVDKLRGLHESTESCLKQPQRVRETELFVQTQSDIKVSYIFAGFLRCPHVRNRRPTLYEARTSDIRFVPHSFCGTGRVSIQQYYRTSILELQQTAFE